MTEPAEILEVDGFDVRVTNPSKVYFPQDGITKLDVVRYWIEVADAALNGCRDRPTTLHRFPDGVEGEGFYQKRLPKGAPEWVQIATITFPSGRHAQMPVMHDAASVAWLATTGCLEINPWPVRVRRRPSRRAARGSRPHARRAVHRCHRRGHGGARRAGRARHGGVPEDLGQARHPHQRPDRAAPGLHGRAARGARLRARGRAPDARTSPRPRGGRRSARACSWTTTRTRATARSRRPTRSARCPTRASPRRCPGMRCPPSIRPRSRS